MGKLIDPGAGDYIDRYSILHLKLRHIAGDYLSGPSLYEADEIERAAPWIDMRLSLVVRITIVNTLLWTTTDEFDEAVRPDVQTNADHIATLAVRMRRLNKQRAELVAELSGIDEAMDEAAKEETDG